MLVRPPPSCRRIGAQKVPFATGRAPMAARAAAVERASVSDTMSRLKQEGKTALVPFICAGDPSLETTAEALVALDEAGSDVIELGVPYSDPLADGATIQTAAYRALGRGATLEKVIAMLAGVSPRISAPIVLFTYFNPIMARGLEKFCADIKAAGASGLLVPDIPLEETDTIREAVNAAGLELVLLTTPTTGLLVPDIPHRHARFSFGSSSVAARAGEERMTKIAQKTQGFLYLVSVTGVTGARASVSDRLEALIATCKAHTDQAVNVGFGVSNAEQARKIKGWGADGVIVGSALVKALASGESEQEGIAAMKQLAVELRQALDA